MFDRVELPPTGQPLELGCAAIGEGDSRSSHEILDGARHEDLARPRLSGDARPDVHGYTADLFANDLALARVQARAYLEPELMD